MAKKSVHSEDHDQRGLPQNVKDKVNAAQRQLEQSRKNRNAQEKRSN